MREGYEIYEAYLDGHQAEIDQGKDFPVEIRELNTMLRRVCRARVAKPPNSFPSGEKLWIKDYKENLLSEPWIIEIIEDLDEDIQPIRGDVARGETPEAPSVW